MSRVPRWVFLVLCAAYFLLPVAVMVHTSLVRDVATTPGLSGTQYASFFRDPDWRSAFVHSLLLALVVAVLATALGLVVALGVVGTRQRAVRLTLEALAVTPVIMPAAVLASALFEVSITVHLFGTSLVVLGQVVLAMPWAYLFVRAGIARLDDTYATAAYSLGESRIGVVLRIRAPLLGPFLLAAAGLSAAVSLSDPLMPVFLGAPGYQTLAQLTWDSLEHGIDNRTAVGGTLIVGTVAVLLAAALLLWRLAVRRRGGREVR